MTLIPQTLTWGGWVCSGPWTDGRAAAGYSLHSQRACLPCHLHQAVVPAFLPQGSLRETVWASSQTQPSQTSQSLTTTLGHLAQSLTHRLLNGNSVNLACLCLPSWRMTQCNLVRLGWVALGSFWLVYRRTCHLYAYLTANTWSHIGLWSHQTTSWLM